MSAQGRSPRGGDGSDLFPTAAWPVARLLERYPLPVGRWLEPCAGDGAIIRAVRDASYGEIDWTAVEIREDCRPMLEALSDVRSMIADFLSDDGDERLFDVAITNPPYVLAGEFLARCLKRTRHVAFLLRVGFLESESRNAFMATCPPDLYILPNRPQFDLTRKGTDATTYAWHVWDADELERPYGRVCILNTTPQEIRKAQRAELLRSYAPVVERLKAEREAGSVKLVAPETNDGDESDADEDSISV